MYNYKKFIGVVNLEKLLNLKKKILKEVAENFSRVEEISEINTSLGERQLRRILADFVINGKLDKRGSTKNTEYALR